MAIKFHPTCFYHPTTLLIVDDNIDLLHDLSIVLAPHYKSKITNSPKKIISWIKSQGDVMQRLVKQWVTLPEEYFEPSQTLVKINIPALRQQIYADPPRFTLETILIVDYSMPEMNGLELSHQIRTLDLPIKIIMLTGEADHQTAIHAFNDKLIDRFILKSAPDYVEKLLEYINDLQKEYFQEITNLLTGAGREAPRNDLVFIQFFNEIAKRVNAVEYYLVENPASYLFLDAQKNPTWLIVKTDEEMQMLYELAKDEKNVPRHTVEILEKKEKLTYFPDAKSKIVPVRDWHLYPAKALQTDNQLYYYAVIEGNQDYPLSIDKITSYQDYLNSST